MREWTTRWLVPMRVEEMFRVINHEGWPVVGAWKIEGVLVIAPVVRLVTAKSHACEVFACRSDLKGLCFYVTSGADVTVDEDGVVQRVGPLHMSFARAEPVVVTATVKGMFRINRGTTSASDYIMPMKELNAQSTLELALRSLKEKKLEKGLPACTRECFRDEALPLLERQIFALSEKAAEVA